MKDTIYFYIQNCHTYRYEKVVRDSYHDILKDLLIFTYFFTNTILDIVIRLLSSNGYNVMLIVID